MSPVPAHQRAPGVRLGVEGEPRSGSLLWASLSLEELLHGNLTETLPCLKPLAWLPSAPTTETKLLILDFKAPPHPPALFSLGSSHTSLPGVPAEN